MTNIQPPWHLVLQRILTGEPNENIVENHLKELCHEIQPNRKLQNTC